MRWCNENVCGLHLCFYFAILLEVKKDYSLFVGWVTHLCFLINKVIHCIVDWTQSIHVRQIFTSAISWRHWKLWHYWCVLLTRKHYLRGSKIVWWMHLLEDICHSLLGISFHSHSCQLSLWNCTLIVTLLNLFMWQEILCHDSTNLLEVFQDLCSWILLLFLLSWTESLKLVVHVKSQFWTCTTIKDND